MSQFLYPPPEASGKASGVLENYKNLDAVNVTWTTPGAQSYSLQLLLLWAQNTTAGETGNFIKILNETVPLNGSRVISMDNGLAYPAVGFFSFQYVYSTGQFVLPGVNCQGFNVTSGATIGKIWSGDNGTNADAPTQLSGNATGPAPLNVTSTTPSNDSSGLGGGAIAGIVVGVAVALLGAFAIVLIFLRRRWKRRTPSVNDQSEPLWMNNISNRQQHEKPLGTYVSPSEAEERILRGELPNESLAPRINELPSETP